MAGNVDYMLCREKNMNEIIEESIPMQVPPCLAETRRQGQVNPM